MTGLGDLKAPSRYIIPCYPLGSFHRCEAGHLAKTSYLILSKVFPATGKWYLSCPQLRDTSLITFISGLATI